MAQLRDEQIVFSVIGADSGPILTIGISAAGWDYMKDGKTHSFDLSSLGMPLRLMLFGAESHDAALKTLEDATHRLGAAVLDDRRGDYGLKGIKKI